LFRPDVKSRAPGASASNPDSGVLTSDDFTSAIH
jgi:hypothetical protein